LRCGRILARHRLRRASHRRRLAELRRNRRLSVLRCAWLRIGLLRVLLRRILLWWKRCGVRAVAPLVACRWRELRAGRIRCAGILAGRWRLLRRAVWLLLRVAGLLGGVTRLLWVTAGVAGSARLLKVARRDLAAWKLATGILRSRIRLARLLWISAGRWPAGHSLRSRMLRYLPIRWLAERWLTRHA
jgi:hypothetical protein